MYLRFSLTITTKTLSLNFLSEKRQKNHNLLMKLHQDGLTDAEIAKFMNESGFVSPKGLKYYSELVFVTRRKIMLRTKRRNETKVKLEKLSFEYRE